MSEVTNSGEISCETCVAACCRAGASMPLEKGEVYRHRRAMKLGTLIKERKYPQQASVPVEVIDSEGRRAKQMQPMRIPANYGFYLLLEDCGNLTEDNQCSAYDDRPKVCATYEVGSQHCLDARAMFGLDGNEAQQELGKVIPAESVKTFKAPPPGLEHRMQTLL